MLTEGSAGPGDDWMLRNFGKLSRPQTCQRARTESGQATSRSEGLTRPTTNYSINKVLETNLCYLVIH
jgi:hypothetical protein